MARTQDPGRLGEIHFPLRLSVLLTVLVIVASGLYWHYPAWRETMVFLGASFAMVAAVLSAYYISDGLRITIEQRDEAIRDARVARAFDLISRWNDADLAEPKHQFREIVDRDDAHDAEKLDAHLDQNNQRKILIEMMNFFEHMALAANGGFADDDTLKAYYKSSITKYHSKLKAWIEKHRRRKNQPTMFVEIETMVERWNRG